MRRVASLLAVVVLAAGAFLAAGAGDGAGDGRYAVDVIFDNVFGVVEGQDVRIAGATVGEVGGLEVTPESDARVHLLIDEEFAPFRDDASCTVQPQSLIGEKFVQCAPGTPQGRPLRESAEGIPTLPVANTVAPVDLSLVLGTFDRPARERLSILLSSLGAGLAGHGEDLNATIRRAAPALEETNRVLGVLDRDRARLKQLADDGDTVLTALDRRKGRVAAFVRETATVVETTAQRRTRLAAAVRGLPALLDETRPALERLTALTKDATPLARELGAAAPDLRRLLIDTGTFSRRIRPTLVALRPALTTLQRALPAVEPQVRRLRRFAVDAVPAVDLLEDLFTSSEANGVLDGAAGFFYYTSVAVSRFDKYGHYLPAYQLGGGTCAFYAKTPVAGCSAKIGESAAASRETNRTRPATATATAPRPAAVAPAAGRPATPSVPRLPGVPKLPAIGELTDPSQLPKAIQDALGPLLGAQRRSTGDAAPFLGYLFG